MSGPTRWRPEDDRCGRATGHAGAHFAIGLDPGQVRLVAEALAARPYAEVHALIGRLRTGAAPFVLGHAELALVLDALAGLPYRRVHVLLDSLRRQLAAARATLREAA